MSAGRDALSPLSIKRDSRALVIGASTNQLESNVGLDEKYYNKVNKLDESHH